MAPIGAVPIQRELVPEAAPAAPAAFTPVVESLRSGVPHRFELAPGLSLVLVVPTGVANAWRYAEPTAVVSASRSQLARAPAPPERAVGALERPPARLLVRSGGQTEGSLALVAGARRLVLLPALGTAVELMILGWEIHAGTVRGAGDYGSRIEVAWRQAAVAADRFRPSATAGRSSSDQAGGMA